MRAFLFASIASTACFGSGPQPPRPADVTVVYATPDPGNDVCNNSHYISAVAIDAANGFAIIEPYSPNNSNCTGGGGGQQPSIVGFDTSGNNPMGTPMGQINGAGAIPRLTITNNGAVWASSTPGSNSIFVPPTSTTVGLSGFNNTNPGLVGMAADNTNLYLAVQQQNMGGCGEEDVANPNWPGGCNSGPQPFAGALFTVPLSMLTPMSVNATQIAIPMAPEFAFDEMADPVAQNPNGVFVATRGTTGGTFTIWGATPTTISPLATVPASGERVPPNVVPVGIDADGTRVVWAAALPAQINSSSPISPGCYVWQYFLPSGPLRLIFHTEKFSCLGGRIAGDPGKAAFYFAVVRSEPNNCNGGGCGAVHGDGVGRVYLDTEQFESLAFGFTGYGAGPRRVYVDYMGPNMYAVDPNAIGRIAKSALDGRTDFVVEPTATTAGP